MTMEQQTRRPPGLGAHSQSHSGAYSPSGFGSGSGGGSAFGGGAGGSGGGSSFGFNGGMGLSPIGMGMGAGSGMGMGMGMGMGIGLGGDDDHIHVPSPHDYRQRGASGSGGLGGTGAGGGAVSPRPIGAIGGHRSVSAGSIGSGARQNGGGGGGSAAVAVASPGGGLPASASAGSGSGSGSISAVLGGADAAGSDGAGAKLGQQQHQHQQQQQMMSSPLSSHAPLGSSYDGQSGAGSSHATASASGAGGASNVWSIPGGASRFLQQQQQGNLSSSSSSSASSASQSQSHSRHAQHVSVSSSSALTNDGAGDNSFANTHGDFYPGGAGAGAGAGPGAPRPPAAAAAAGADQSADAETDGDASGDTSRVAPSNGAGAGAGTPRLFLDTGSAPRQGGSPSQAQAPGQQQQQRGGAGGGDDGSTPLARPTPLAVSTVVANAAAAGDGANGNGNGTGTGSASPATPGGSQPHSPAHFDRLAIIREKNASRAAAAAAAAAAQAQAQGSDAANGNANANANDSSAADFAALRSKSPQRADSGGGISAFSDDAQMQMQLQQQQQQQGFQSGGATPQQQQQPSFGPASATSPLVLTGISGWGTGAGGGSGAGAGNGSGFGRAATPLLSLPGSAFDTANAGAAGGAGGSRYGSLAGGLLSPSAATLGFGHASASGQSNSGASAFSPVSSPTALHAPGSNAFAQGFAAGPSPPHAGHQQQHFGGAQGGGGGGGGHLHAGQHQPPQGANPRAAALYAPQAHAGGAGALLVPSEYDSPLDVQLKQSPLVLELVERLVRLEIGLKDLQRQVGGISRSVNHLQDRARGAAGAGQGSGPGSAGASGPFARAQSPQIGSAFGTRNLDGLPSSSDEIRNLSAQLSSLSTSVAQLYQSQQQLQGGFGGLVGGNAGAGGGLPPRATSPLIPSGGASAFGGSQARLGAGIDTSSRLSPRPFQGAQGNRLSWGGGGSEMGITGSAGGLGGGRKPAGSRRDSSAGGGGGGYGDAMSNGPGGPPGGDNFVITKWDHLNLHSDLLRSILKYGLGPPNKIQQRALPFLLRGNDIIAQAPPTQERIASYVIPALQHVLTALREPGIPSNARGPIVLMISTTVDQATQAQRMALGLGSPIGLRVHIAAAAGIDVASELQTMSQINPHIVIGTPQKMSELFTQLVARNVLPANDVRLVVLDEVDQLIARNLSDHVSSMLRVLPMPRSGAAKPSTASAAKSAWDNAGSVQSPGSAVAGSPTMDRQTAIFSNTVPQDVLNFAQSIHLRESVRVLVRRENSNMIGGSGGSSGGPGGSSGLGVGPPSSVGNGTFGAGSVTGPYGSQAGGYRGQGSQLGAGTPSNALGSTPMINISANPLADPMLAALRGLRQYYLYVAVSGASSNPLGGATSALEMKLDVITDLLEDMDFGQAVIYTNAPGTTEAVTYKLSSKGIESLALHKDMASATRAHILQKFRAPGSAFASHGASMGSARKALVINDTALSPKEVHQVPLVVFYDLPRSVDEYKEKLACASSNGISRPGVCVNVVTASGGPKGDIEMLRTLECHLGCKMAEMPMDPRSILNF